MPEPGAGAMILYRVYMHSLASPRPLWHVVPVDEQADTKPDIQLDLAPAKDDVHAWEVLPWKVVRDLAGAGWRLTLAVAPPHCDAALRLYTCKAGEETTVLFGRNAERIVVRWRTRRQDNEQFQRGLSSWLLGSVLGHAMSLRGLPTLHGSVVEVDGRAVALLGESGAGKSTLAGAFVAAGDMMLADDHLVVRRVVTQKGGATWHALPGPPRLRLWPSSMSVLDGPAQPLSAWTDNDGKRHLEPGAAAYCSTPQPLAAVYLLMARDSGRWKAAIEDLAPAAALHVLMQQRFSTMGLDATYTAASLAALSELAQETPVRRLYRPDGLETLASVVAAVRERLERDGG